MRENDAVAPGGDFVDFRQETCNATELPNSAGIPGLYEDFGREEALNDANKPSLRRQHDERAGCVLYRHELLRSVSRQFDNK